jgi:hypothetical protein
MNGRGQTTMRNAAVLMMVSCLLIGCERPIEEGLAYLDDTAKASGQAAKCTNYRIVPAEPWQDVWTTSVYSYAPDKKTPGGGLVNDELKVGGWGDQYFSYIKFNISRVSKPKQVFLSLFSKGVSGSVPVSMNIELVLKEWGWTDRLWWKDRPPSRSALVTVPAPARDRWYSVDVSYFYNQWSANVGNFGLVMQPTSTNNEFNVFVSSRAAEQDKRPKLIQCD